MKLYLFWRHLPFSSLSMRLDLSVVLVKANLNNEDPEGTEVFIFLITLLVFKISKARTNIVVAQHTTSKPIEKNYIHR